MINPNNPIKDPRKFKSTSYLHFSYEKENQSVC